MNAKVLISKQALDRAKRDKYIQNNKDSYTREIYMIQSSYAGRPREVIRKFLISPRGGKKIRVAWFFEYNKRLDTIFIYIADLLYHITDKYYVDKWNEKVKTGRINLSSYSDYTPWAGF